MEESSKPTTEELIWIAGFFDGEGCVTICKNRDSLHLVAAIGNTQFEVLYWLKDLFGGSVCGVTKTSNNCKLAKQWSIQNIKAGLFLEQILPYLRLKREVAELGLSFQETKGWGIYNRYIRLPEDTMDYRYYLRECIQELNHRGIN